MKSKVIGARRSVMSSSVCALLVALTLTSCESSPPLKPQPPSPEIIEQVLQRRDELLSAKRVDEQLRARDLKIQGLMSLAQLALSKDRLMMPPEDNAFTWYRQILSIDQHYVTAHEGMKKITARYLQLAEQAYNKGLYRQVDLMLARAGKVSAPPSLLDDLRERYRTRKVAAVADNEFYLSVVDLDARNENLTKNLQALVAKIIAQQSRLLIIARSDREGRWLYQQMRGMAKGVRLRGNIQLGAKPKVVLIDMSATGAD